jgi:3D (Asp-Asp-Asp) domain-containing protein
VEEFFQERDITLQSRDTLNMLFTDSLRSGSRVELKRAFYVDVYVDGLSREFRVSQDTTVGRFIRLFQEENEQQYHHVGSLLPILVPGDTIHLETLREETVVEEQEIPFESNRNETEELVVGTEEIAQEGQLGKLVTTYQVLFLRDEEYSRELISEVVEVEPQTQIIRVGTAVPTPTPTQAPPPAPVPAAAPAAPNANAGASSGFSLGARVASVSYLNYSRMIRMESTAYTSGFQCTGKRPGDPGYGITASGMHVQHGVVAVDPGVIPLGTRLYVEGYGFAIAADTGGAIRGNKIDVFMYNLSDALVWGRRPVNVYILE